ncbi:hypothetical protein CBL_01164 [Carabus blaptoides fortunei]
MSVPDIQHLVSDTLSCCSGLYYYYDHAVSCLVLREGWSAVTVSWWRGKEKTQSGYPAGNGRTASLPPSQERWQGNEATGSQRERRDVYMQRCQFNERSDQVYKRGIGPSESELPLPVRPIRFLCRKRQGKEVAVERIEEKHGNENFRHPGTPCRIYANDVV